MYRRYYNEYEKKADEIKQSIEGQNEIKSVPSPEKNNIKIAPDNFFGLNNDDILLGAIIFFLLREGNIDKKLLLALGFIFISGF